MKSCFDGYLTEACETCEFWKNTEKEIGCCVPFPISHCEHFEKMQKEHEKEAVQ